MAQENNATHWVMGGALILIGLFVVIALVLVRSEAQNVTTTIDNAAPIIVDGTEKFCLGTLGTGDLANSCSDQASLTLNAGSTLAITAVATVRDTNGRDDLDAATALGAFYYDSGSETEACTADNNNCYKQTAGNCTLSNHTGQTSTDTWIICQYTLQYFANESIDAGVWNGFFEVDDVAGSTANNSGSEETTEIAKLVASTFPDVAFGSRALGTQSTIGNNVDLSHTNNGNVDVDFQVSLDDDDTDSAIDCATGTIPVGNVEWNYDVAGTPGDLAYGSVGNTDLIDENDGGAPATIAASICRRTNDTAAQGPTNPRTATELDCTVTNQDADDVAYTYWNIEIPASGVLGACSEGLNVTVVES